MEVQLTENAPTVMPYVPLVAGSLARTIACITCYPIELARTRMQVLSIDKERRSSFYKCQQLGTSMLEKNQTRKPR